MQSEGKKGSYNPAARLASLVSKREKLQEELHNIERQVYELETSYLQESSHFGNAFKGFDGFLSASKNTTNLKRSRKLQPEDRIFSLSSVTSPVAEEQGVGRDDGRSDVGQGRAKGSGLAANGHSFLGENQRKEEQDQEMQRKSGCRVIQILMMKMILDLSLG
ncbi:uncharacterized protein LOC127799527 isoform X2 [Diospyros lotus]|uniref:uncharacterized protein LOC127799527 isoform X2 n=1 Tax=Diospyros lotus TaxID=55363 RepID=UPI00224CA746|nr:uncharacterized protein LOC127799527 isoform X2 [Diospyros lotus]